MQGRIFSNSFRNREAVQGQEASWESQTLAQACWVPTLGGVGRPRRPRRCLLVTAKERVEVNSGWERSTSGPRVGLLLQLSARGGSQGPSSWGQFQDSGAMDPCQEIPVAQSGLTVTLPFTGDPRASASPGQALEGIHEGQLLCTEGQASCCPSVCVPQPPAFHSPDRDSGRGT